MHDKQSARGNVASDSGIQLIQFAVGEMFHDVEATTGS